MSRELARSLRRSRATNHARIPHDERGGLLARVSRLELMSDGKDEDDVFGRQPTVFGDISVTAESCRPRTAVSSTNGLRVYSQLAREK